MLDLFKSHIVGFLMRRLKGHEYVFVTLTDVVSEPENAYWWVDGQFRPNDDTTLFVTSGCYRMPRTHSSWVLAKRMPAGRIVKYDLGGENISMYTLL